MLTSLDLGETLQQTLPTVMDDTVTESMRASRATLAMSSHSTSEDYEEEYNANANSFSMNE